MNESPVGRRSQLAITDCSQREATPTSLPLRELEAFSRSRLPILLTLCLTRITRQKAFLLQYTAQFGTEFNQGPRDSVLHRVGLAVHTAAVDVDHDIKLVQGVGCL